MARIAPPESLRGSVGNDSGRHVRSPSESLPVSDRPCDLTRGSYGVPNTGHNHRKAVIIMANRTSRAANRAGSDQGNEPQGNEPQGNAPQDGVKRGRRPQCKQMLANGRRCELPAGHDQGPNPTEHNTVTLTEDEITDIDLDDAALAELLGETKTPGVRPAEQIKVDEQVKANFAEWSANGADTSKPVWKVKAVAPHKRQETEKLLRKAADILKDPPVGMRIKTGPIRDGKALVIWAAVKRMETAETPAETS